MTIDTINISTFGLKLLAMDGYYDLAARKKILPSTGSGTEAKDIVFDSKNATLTLIGKYTDVLAMLDNLNAFETLIKSDLKHDIVLVGHGENFTGVFDKGFEVIPMVGGKIVKLVVPVTIIDN